jgi:hypothetical protein
MPVHPVQPPWVRHCLGRFLFESFSGICSFAVFWDLGRWLFIEGQKKIAFAAHNETKSFLNLILNFPKFKVKNWKVCKEWNFSPKYNFAQISV